MANVPENIYHTTLTVIDYHVDTSGSTQKVYVLGTHTQLAKAKEFAARALHELGYEKEDFAEYAERKAGEEWTHGDGVIVYTRAEAGQEFLVGIDTKPNMEKLPEKADGTGELELPKGIDHLHYVLQTKIDYNQDRSGSYQETEIEGCYLKRADAFAAARKALVNDQMKREDFAQYDERQDTTASDESWPFGEDVLVHAIAPTGENYTVAVRIIPSAYKKFSKASH